MSFSGIPNSFQSPSRTSLKLLVDGGLSLVCQLDETTRGESKPQPRVSGNERNSEGRVLPSAREFGAVCGAPETPTQTSRGVCMKAGVGSANQNAGKRNSIFDWIFHATRTEVSFCSHFPDHFT
eukprot:INCI12457.1.p3 GENE.INCI12457.1~~INCI12457.1.p3  ORF type:complete len:124 (-),score=16.04 INCI12457.1:207-578(-)